MSIWRFAIYYRGGIGKQVVSIIDYPIQTQDGGLIKLSDIADAANRIYGDALLHTALEKSDDAAYPREPNTTWTTVERIAP